MEASTELIYGNAPPVLVLRTAVLRVVEGPCSGRGCDMASQRVSVGTALSNDLQLDDGQVSREHLEVRVVDQGYLVRDLRSTNGTYFRGARVTEALLGVGAELRVGQSVLRIERGEERSGSVPGKQRFGSLIGLSAPMQRLYGMLDAVAPSDLTVLVRGETGTGKELVAEELHRHSPRRERIFSVLDCAALSPQLVESELFGHERGAFTGAARTHIGIFERAHGGTVFIDEIGELPLALQTRLLRVLDQRTVQRVGSALPRKVDIRLVGATHRDLAKAVQEGRFRQDLYYRMAVVEIRVPPLRERKEDIPALAKHFLWQAGTSLLARDPQLARQCA
ncbi:MAG: sigma 54-dependent Fis family transcriptional regulator [Deltaproteobacteria bacterium]|nr:sigma 54-dependent Fis family transcriptional regulator [Deltaproteobacteria bacterium]